MSYHKPVQEFSNPLLPIIIVFAFLVLIGLFFKFGFEYLKFAWNNRPVTLKKKKDDDED